MEKEWKKLETLPAKDLEKDKSKKEAILAPQRGKLHFATLMDTCHLKNSELEPKITEV